MDCEIFHVKGTCTKMCPKSESTFRSKNSLLHTLEQNSFTVKEYSRSAAGKLFRPEDVRTPDVLLKTIDYLIDKIIPRTDVPFAVVYDFADNRIQAIRQDLVVQNIENEISVEILEKAVRFYVVSQYILFEEPVSVFDPHLNDQQLMICLKHLLISYSKRECHANREEFLSIYSAYKLGSPEVLHYVLNARLKYGYNGVLQEIIQMNFLLLQGNFLAFFKIYELLPSILQYCFVPHINRVRLLMLKVFNTAYSSKNSQFPIMVLHKWLHMSEENTADFCYHFGLKVDAKHVCFFKNGFNNHNSGSFNSLKVNKSVSRKHLCKMISESIILVK